MNNTTNNFKSGDSVTVISGTKSEVRHATIIGAYGPKYGYKIRFRSRQWSMGATGHGYFDCNLVAGWN